MNKNEKTQITEKELIEILSLKYICPINKYENVIQPHQIKGIVKVAKNRGYLKPSNKDLALEEIKKIEKEHEGYPTILTHLKWIKDKIEAIQEIE